MSDDHVPTWESLKNQAGEMVRIVLDGFLGLLRTKPVVLLVLVCTAAISYETLYQLAHGDAYHSVWWIAFLFPLQLDLAALPGIQVVFDRDRAPGQRWLGGIEAGVAGLASVFGNLAAHFGWTDIIGPYAWLATATVVFIAVISPVMCAFCLLIAHLPAPATRVGVSIDHSNATADSVDADVESVTLHSVDGSPFTLHSRSEPEVKAWLWARYAETGEVPTAPQTYRAMPKALRREARKMNNVPRFVRKVRDAVTPEEVTG